MCRIANLANCGDDRIRTLKWDHVVAVGNHDALAARRLARLAHLQIVDPELAKVVQIFLSDAGRQELSINAFARGESYERFISQRAGGVYFFSRFRRRLATRFQSLARTSALRRNRDILSIHPWKRRQGQVGELP